MKKFLLLMSLVLAFAVSAQNAGTAKPAPGKAAPKTEAVKKAPAKNDKSCQCAKMAQNGKKA